MFSESDKNIRNQRNRFAKRIGELEEELQLILSQVINFDDLFEIKVMARAHAMRLGIEILEKDSGV